MGQVQAQAGGDFGADHRLLPSRAPRDASPGLSRSNVDRNAHWS